MIKKNTKAIFADGEFKGEYDWQGGIPLSEGEVMTVRIKSKVFKYRLDRKEITCSADKDNQNIDIVYRFRVL